MATLRKSTKIVIAAIAVVIVVAIVAGIIVATGKGKIEEGNTLRYIVNNYGDIVNYDIALEKGFFEDEGLKVEEAGLAGGGAAAIQAVAGGQADICNAAIPAFINAAAAGTPIKVIYGGPAIGSDQNPGYQLLIRADDDTIKTPQDLKGKTIALGAKGAMFEFITRQYLAKGGLTVDDVNIIVVPIAQHEQVLQSKQADLVVDGSPIADQMIESGTAKKLSDLYTVLGPELAGSGWGYFMNSDLMAKYPETTKKLVAALVKTDQWTEANPDEAREVVKKILAKHGQNTELAKYWKPVKLVNYGLWPESMVTYWINFMVDNNIVKKDAVKPSDIYTNEYNPYDKNNGRN
ncbi:MAG TPA: ABC transporter substrate-binding protein [Desulfosporosinus sp.]|nr:ABC transporter substrate-binding protein [Desulfosporosinus sp.]